LIKRAAGEHVARSRFIRFPSRTRSSTIPLLERAVQRQAALAKPPPLLGCVLWSGAHHGRGGAGGWSAEVVPLLFNFDVRCIDAGRIVGRTQKGLAPSVQIWRIALDPAKHCGVIDPYAAFPYAFSHVALAQGVAHIPTPGAENDVSLTVAPCEPGMIAHGRSPVFRDRYCLARGINSSAILAMGPDAVASGHTLDNRHGSHYSGGPSIGMRPRELRRTGQPACWLRQWLTIGWMIS
jgi:hypothetical protein